MQEFIKTVAFLKVKAQSFGDFMCFCDRFPVYISSRVFKMIIFIQIHAYTLPILPHIYMYMYIVHITMFWYIFSSTWHCFVNLINYDSEILYHSLSSISKNVCLYSTKKVLPCTIRELYFLNINKTSEEIM